MVAAASGLESQGFKCLKCFKLRGFPRLPLNLFQLLAQKLFLCLPHTQPNLLRKAGQASQTD